MRINHTSAQRGATVPALPMPYPQLNISIYRGHTSLTVAAPAAGKSMFWLNMAQRMRVPTCYWSADSDQRVQTLRTLALHTAYTIQQVEEMLADEKWRAHLFRKLGNKSDHIDWVFDSPITGKRLGERLNAFFEVRGEYPHLVILDNLSNAIQDPSNEYAEIKTVQTKAQELARETGAHIAILHHAKGEFDASDKPIPQSGGLQNPFKIPELGLTLYKPDQDRLAVNVVKDRNGKSDPAAKHPYVLPIDFSRASVMGYQTEGKVA